MSNLTNLDVFQILGLNNVTEEEKNQYLLRISKISIQQAIEKALKDGLLNIDDVERVSQETKDSVQLQEKLIQMCPSLVDYIQGAIDNMKIEILQKQVDETLQQSLNSQNQDITSALDLKSYLNLPVEEMEENTLIEKVHSFRKLQDNMLIQQNGQ